MSDSAILPTVLIVDDEPANISILAGALDDSYNVKVAANGNEALKVAHHGPPPELILLDALMPDMTGFEVCQRLREKETTAEVPVIFVTSLDDQINEEKGFQVGAVDYIYKPISVAIVRARVKVHVEHRLYSEALELLLSQRSEELEKLKAQTLGLAPLLGKLRIP